MRKGKRVFYFILNRFLYYLLILFCFSSIYCMLFLKQCKKESQNKTKVRYLGIWSFIFSWLSSDSEQIVFVKNDILWLFKDQRGCGEAGSGVGFIGSPEGQS